ncbi:MAG: hypothetical protein ACYDFT_02220 [Thermoplasmata archaeon]
MTIPAGPARVPPTLPRKHRIALNGMLGLLGLQFLIGMYLNLFPASWSSTGRPAPTLPTLFGPSSSDVPVLVLHGVLGAALFLLAMYLVYLFIGNGRRSWLGGCITGLFATLLAGIGGAGFLDGGNAPADSFLMAVGFLAAFWAYFWVRVRSAAALPVG